MPRPVVTVSEPERASAGVLFWICALFAVLIRSCVGLHNHSGESLDHDGMAAYGGDYEAQRHWMEITYHLPFSEWYSYDLEYWGLDYPPLTAYVSWVCGYFSRIVCGEETVALDASRGYEDPTHKSFMRFSVLLLDVLVYFPAVWAICGLLCEGRVVRISR